MDWDLQPISQLQSFPSETQRGSTTYQTHTGLEVRCWQIPTSLLPLTHWMALACHFPICSTAVIHLRASLPVSPVSGGAVSATQVLSIVIKTIICQVMQIHTDHLPSSGTRLLALCLGTWEVCQTSGVMTHFSPGTTCVFKVTSISVSHCSAMFGSNW